MHALVLLAHGSSDPDWSSALRALRDKVDDATGLPVRLAFLEKESPSLEEAVAMLVSVGQRSVKVVPVLLGAGRHFKEDLPPRLASLRSEHPSLVIEATAPIGEVESVLDALATAITALSRQ